MKAYKISCADDDHGMVVMFAERAKDLRGHRSRDSCDCEYIEIAVRRASDFDKYAPGPVTVEQYLCEGWFWMCQNCDVACFHDSSPIIIDDQLFCGRECLIRYIAGWEQAKSRGEHCIPPVDEILRPLIAYRDSHPEESPVPVA